MYTVILFWYVCNVTALFFSLQILFLEKFVGTNIRKKKIPFTDITNVCGWCFVYTVVYAVRIGFYMNNFLSFATKVTRINVTHNHYSHLWWHISHICMPQKYIILSDVVTVISAGNCNTYKCAKVF